MATALIKDLLDWAKENLGPSSLAKIKSIDPEELDRRSKNIQDVSEFALEIIYPFLSEDHDLRREFFGHLWQDIDFKGFVHPNTPLSQFVETNDLAASCFGDMMSICQNLEFRGKREFVAMIRQRMRWKAHRKALHEEKIVSAKNERLGAIEDKGKTVESKAIELEDRVRFMRFVAKLPPKERTLLECHLNDIPIADIAQINDRSVDTTRKAIQRIIQRMRRSLGQA